MSMLITSISQHCSYFALMQQVLLQARHFEFSNESWKTNQAAQYAWALMDWVPAIKAAHPGALIGANGPAGKLEVGDKDQGVPWWPQVYCKAVLRCQNDCQSCLPTASIIYLRF